MNQLKTFIKTNSNQKFDNFVKATLIIFSLVYFALSNGVLGKMIFSLIIAQQNIMLVIENIRKVLL